MKIKKLLLALGILMMMQLNAQENDKYDILLMSGAVKPIANSNKLTEQRALKNELISGNYFRIIQFNQIPTDNEKNELKSKGVILLDYLPNFSFYAAIKESADLASINSRGSIRAVMQILPEYKIHPEIKGNKLPADAEVIKGKADLALIYFKEIPADVIIKELKLKIKGLTVIEQDHASQTIKVRVSKKLVSKIPLISCIQYVEPVRQFILENNSGTTLVHSNTINSFVSGGLRYDGTGVGVSIGDGGLFFSHVDFTGRQTAGLASGGADHATHVAGITGGAGNIDPKYAGHAPGASLLATNGFNDISSVNAITTLYNGTNKIRVTNHSLGETVNDGYTSTARMSDLQVASLPSIFNVHSAGNSGTGWNTITGGYKAGKNSIAMGALDYAGVVTSFSSRGPSKDGRIKPDVCTKGGAVFSCMPDNAYGNMSGTSMASPAGAGCFSQLIHAYRTLNAGSDPTLAQLKCIVLNTAEDRGNVGPDYTYGWGKVNVWKAYKAIEDKRYLSSTVAQGANKTHVITVPANVKELKVMIYWADPAATAGVSKALINDLDMTLISSTQTYNPWTLNFSSPGTAATKGKDRDNNMEQVTVSDPAAGSYTVNVNGFLIPQGSQEYWVTYEYLTDDIKLMYPMGGESFVPGETEYIRWDTYGSTGNFTIDYSTDGGSTWTNITSSATGTSRFFAWVVPTIVNGQAQVRVTRNGKTGKSDANFNIIKVPTALKIDWRCPANFQLSWTAVAGATSYEVFLLGQKYMVSQGTTAALKFEVQSTNAAIRWVSVKALAANGTVIGRRAVAIQVPTSVTSCATDLATVNGSDYQFSINPNPMNNHADISLNVTEEENISIKLIDVCGKEVLSVIDSEKLSSGEHQFKIENTLATGIYLVMIKGNKGVSYKKIIVTDI